MNKLTPEMLVEKMANGYDEQSITKTCDAMLRIVLQAIEDGGVASVKTILLNRGEYDEEKLTEVVLNPSFSKFLEGA